MADSILINGQVTYGEGVYTSIDSSGVSGVSPAAKGVVALLMESPTGGQPKTPVRCSNAAVLRQYLTEPDATVVGNLLFNPSKDPRIPGGAAAVYFVRVNPATQASLTRNDAGGDPAMKLLAYDYGVLGNDIQCKLEAGTSGAGYKKVTAVAGSTTEVADDIKVDNDVIGFEHTDSITDASVTVHATTVQIDPLGTLGALSTSGVVVSQNVTIGELHTWTVLATDSVAFDGKLTFTCAHAQTVDFTIIGVRKDTGATVTETLSFVGDLTKTTAYAYSSITSITVPNLTTDTTAVVNWYAFDMIKATYNTIAKVIARIQQKTANGFDATAKIANTGFLVADLDADGPKTLPLIGTEETFEAQLYYLIAGINANITLVDAERVTATGDDIPADFGLTNLTGGTDGVASTGTGGDWDDGLTAIQDININHVVCLTTDAAVHALLGTHLTYMAGRGKNERNGFCGCPAQTNIGDLWTKTLALNNRNLSFCAQQINVYDHTGTATWFDPQYTAVLACGCDAGRLTDVSLIWANVDVLDVKDNPDDGADSWTVRDNLEDLLAHGVLVLRKDVATGLRKWSRDVTTYLTDQNPIFCSVYANESTNISVKNVRAVLEAVIGRGTFTGTVQTIRQIVLGELGRQKANNEIKDYDPRSIAITDFGNGFDVDYRFAPTEAVTWIRQTAHVARMSSTTVA
jgi:hypothetical protein